MSLPALATGALKSELRYGLPNGADPSISFSVKLDESSGRLLYSYLVDDRGESLQPSRRFSVLLPDYDDTLRQDNAGSWISAVEATAFPDRSSTRNGGLMRFASWSNSESGLSKVNNLSLTLQSAYLPGLAEAYVEGSVANELTGKEIANLPTEVRADITFLQEPAYRSKQFVVLAPLFPPEVSKEIVAANYRFGIDRLMHHGVSTSSSPFFLNILKTLDIYLQSGIINPADLQAVPPTSAIEQQIQSSFAIAFR